MLSIEETKKFSSDYCKNHFPLRFERANRYRFEEDRLHCIGAGALLFEILGLSEKDISVDENGKPFSSAIQTCFNISHSGDYVCIALGEMPVGVDIEKNRYLVNVPKKRVLTEKENHWLDFDGNNHFLQLWTLKESVAKLFGTGLKADFAFFDVLPFLHDESIVAFEKIVFGKSVLINNHFLSVCSFEPLEELCISEFKRK